MTTESNQLESYIKVDWIILDSISKLKNPTDMRLTLYFLKQFHFGKFKNTTKVFKVKKLADILETTPKNIKESLYVLSVKNIISKRKVADGIEITWNTVVTKWLPSIVTKRLPPKTRKGYQVGNEMVTKHRVQSQPQQYSSEPLINSFNLISLTKEKEEDNTEEKFIDFVSSELSWNMSQASKVWKKNHSKIDSFLLDYDLFSKWSKDQDWITSPKGLISKILSDDCVYPNKFLDWKKTKEDNKRRITREEENREYSILLKEYKLSPLSSECLTDLKEQVIDTALIVKKLADTEPSTHIERVSKGRINLLKENVSLVKKLLTNIEYDNVKGVIG